jgi:hypothetical protein
MKEAPAGQRISEKIRGNKREEHSTGVMELIILKESGDALHHRFLMPLLTIRKINN